MLRKVLFVVVALACAAGVLAQTPTGPPRPASPAGTAATQVGGKWIEVTYGRPILRQRANIFGAGADYGKTVNDGSPVWRAGANQTTRLKTEVPLVFGGKTLPAGEYSVFVELKPGAWTLIFSNWPAQANYDPKNTAALWGSIGYTPDKDVLRMPMAVSSLPFSMDEFTIAFIDMTAESGKIAMMWEKTIAVATFKVGS